MRKAKSTVLVFALVMAIGIGSPVYADDSATDVLESMWQSLVAFVTELLEVEEEEAEPNDLPNVIPVVDPVG